MFMIGSFAAFDSRPFIAHSPAREAIFPLVSAFPGVEALSDIFAEGVFDANARHREI
jgi:hypothetical protein